jgi:hypothetical protein
LNNKERIFIERYWMHSKNNPDKLLKLYKQICPLSVDIWINQCSKKRSYLTESQKYHELFFDRIY